MKTLKFTGVDASTLVGLKPNMKMASFSSLDFLHYHLCLYIYISRIYVQLEMASFLWIKGCL